MTPLKPTQTDPHFGKRATFGWPVETATTEGASAPQPGNGYFTVGVDTDVGSSGLPLGLTFESWFPRSGPVVVGLVCCGLVPEDHGVLGWFVAVSGCFFFFGGEMWSGEENE